VFTVIVHLVVKPERIDEFLEGIRLQARAALDDEPGCLRFDVHRSTEQPCQFYLYEIYRDEDAFVVEHRRAAHYATWLEVAERCLEPGGRINTFATPAFPDDLPEAGERARAALGQPS
jgi:autoinducer 2-degrading protein